MKNVIRVENGSIINGQGGSGGSGGHTIQNDSGTALAQESALQFVGVYSEDDSTNGKTKVNIIREMTKAQMDALSTDAKKGVIHTTDEPDNPANPISADDVTYGDETVEDALDALNEATTSDGLHNIAWEEDFTVSEYFNYFKIGRLVVVNVGGLMTANSAKHVTVTRNLPIQRSRPLGCLMNDTSNDNAVLYGEIGTTWLRIAVHSINVRYYGQFVYLTD